MAYTPTFSQTNFASMAPSGSMAAGFGSEQDQLSEEEKRRRQALMISLATGGGFGEALGQYATDKIGMPNQQAPASGPVAPEQVAQSQPQAQQVPEQLPAQGPISPEMAQQPVEQPQLPQPGPAVQVAGATQMPRQEQYAGPSQGAEAQTVGQAVTPSMAQMGAQAQQPVVTPEQKYNDAIIAAGNETDPAKRRNMFAQVLANKDVSEGSKTLANRLIAEDYLKQKAISDAEQKISEATPNDLSRYMRERTKEGSYVKAILYSRLGLNDLAQKEQELLSPTLKMGVALDETGKQYTVERDNMGAIVRGFDSNGKTLNQETLAKLSAGGLPTQAYMMPSVHGTPVQRTNQEGQVETGLMMYDPRTRQSYVQVGSTRQPTTGWTTMSQTPQSVYNAAGAGQQGKNAADFNQQQPALPPMAVATTPASTTEGTGQPAGTGTGQPAGTGTPSVTATKNDKGTTIIKPNKAATSGGVGGGATPPVQGANESPAAFRARLETYNKAQAAAIEKQKELELARQKPPEEAKGKVEVKQIQQQAFADSAYPIVSQIGSIIKQSTGSGLGASIDELARTVGVSTKGGQAIKQLEVFAGPLVSMVPRFEGAQSDADVREYQRQAGDFANPKLTDLDRIAALQGMIKLMKIYDKNNTNDWNALTPQSKIKIIKRERVQ